MTKGGCLAVYLAIGVIIGELIRIEHVLNAILTALQK